MKTNWIVGTRGSKLALKQTEVTIGLLKKVYPDYDYSVKIIKTKGDTVWDAPLHLVGGKGLFVKEIEEALIRKEIDMAVHSMKDLPTELEGGLVLAAILEREDPRDVFISLTYDKLEDLKGRAKVGTGSIRRKSQILNFNKNIEIVTLRGNVDTRIRKLSDQALDGIVLAYAGIKRMGYDSYVKEILPFEIMVPPSGQGAIGIETRDDGESHEMLKPINHARSFLEVSLERKLQTGIGGGCQTPLGINVSIDGDTFFMYVALGNEEGELFVKEKLVGCIDSPDEAIGKALEMMSRHK
jgi:hydroxymethylbilane synthase